MIINHRINHQIQRVFLISKTILSLIIQKDFLPNKIIKTWTANKVLNTIVIIIIKVGVIMKTHLIRVK